MKKSVIIFVLLSLLPEVCFAADMLPDSVAYRAGKWFQYVPYAHLLYADEHPEYFCEAAADPRCCTYSFFVGARYKCRTMTDIFRASLWECVRTAATIRTACSAV